MTSEFGRQIHPCKGCVSTAMPLCHWPCSCYPNYAVGQTDDWMNEIYERWAARARHHHRDAGLLVPGAERAQADDRPPGLRRRRQPGPDVDAWQERRGGEAARARRAGRIRSILPAARMAWSFTATWRASKALRRALSDWLDWMGLDRCRQSARGSTATSATTGPTRRATTNSTATQAVQEEVRNVARAVAQAVIDIRAGRLSPPDAAIRSPRPK